MVLFFVGILEMLIVTAWTKTVTKTQIIPSGLITVVNVMIWYYVLETIVNHINDWRIVFLYACGCAAGTMITTFYFHLREKKSLIASELNNNS